MKLNASRTFNNISEKLKAEIPVLKQGEVVVFQMLNGTPNPEPDEKERSKSPVLYGKRQVQTNFRIFDPYQKDSSGLEVGGYVDVGCVEHWNGDNPSTFRFFVPGQGEFSQFQGKFSLTGGNIKDMELFEVLWLSNEREGNPHRDKSVAPLFKIIDKTADNKASITRVDTLRKALALADTLKKDVKKSKQIMAALNKNYSEDEIEGEIAKLASSKPEVLIQVYESKDTPMRALLKEAMDAGILNHDFATGKVKLGDVDIHVLKTSTSDSFITEMVKWIETSDNGQDVLSNIKSRMKAQIA